jgi:hypothetical protein
MLSPVNYFRVSSPPGNIVKARGLYIFGYVITSSELRYLAEDRRMAVREDDRQKHMRVNNLQDDTSP